MTSDQRVLTPEGLQAARRWHMLVAILLLALVLFLPGLTGIGPNSWKACVSGAARTDATPAAAPAATTAVTPTPPAPAPAAASAVAATPAVASAAAPAAPAPTVAPAAVTAAASAVALYYDSGAWGLPAKADATLAPIVAALNARPGAKAVISGFHDARGDAQRNRDLAYKRARGVGQALSAAGIDASRIELVKPQQTTGGGDPAQARRVEVSLRD